jgi:DNA polymerase III delta subunit
MSMHYLFLGHDVRLRDAKLKQLKGNLFPTSDAEKLDFEILDGHKLTSEAIKVALASAPALSVRRLVLISRAEKLSKENLATIEQFLKDTPENPVLFLEAASWDMKSETRKSIRARLQVIGTVEKDGRNVFDMMDAVCTGNTVDALALLKELLNRGEEEERLIGGMVWAWSNKMKGRTSVERYKKGLLILQEADHHLKRSRFPSREQALEIAVVKLSSMLKV